MNKYCLFLGALLCFSIHGQESTQPFSQGDERLSNTTVAAYNYPARTKLNQSCNLFVTASYIYWYAGEDGLDLATTAGYLSGSNTVVPSSHSDKTIFQNFEYQSGFKVGIGYLINNDDWVLRADYTRLHLTTHTSKSAPSSGVGIGVLYTSDWFFQTSSQSQTLAATDLSSKWHLGLDWLDLALERPFYCGQKFTLTPFMGLRASWIDQTLNLDASGIANVTPPTTSLESRNHLKSWGIGPRFGIDGRWLLGCGFRIQGDAGASILFTQFTEVSHSEDPFTAGGTVVSYAYHDYNCLRPMVEASLGLAWGKYLSNQRYHFDLSATFDFNCLWNQNMMRALNDANIIGTDGSANDLFLYGLTITAAFSF